jgi:hypothetical protein
MFALAGCGPTQKQLEESQQETRDAQAGIYNICMYVHEVWAGLSSESDLRL